MEDSVGEYTLDGVKTENVATTKYQNVNSFT